MIQTLSLYTLAILLSLSILGPSCMAWFENDPNVEVMQDLEEENNEPKKELEECEKIVTEFFSFSFEIINNTDLSSHYYLVKTYGHIRDINAPPPDLS